MGRTAARPRPVHPRRRRRGGLSRLAREPVRARQRRGVLGGDGPGGGRRARARPLPALRRVDEVGDAGAQSGRVLPRLRPDRPRRGLDPARHAARGRLAAGAPGGLERRHRRSSGSCRIWGCSRRRSRSASGSCSLSRSTRRARGVPPVERRETVVPEEDVHDYDEARTVDARSRRDDADRRTTSETDAPWDRRTRRLRQRGSTARRRTGAFAAPVAVQESLSA